MVLGDYVATSLLVRGKQRAKTSFTQRRRHIRFFMPNPGPRVIEHQNAVAVPRGECCREGRRRMLNLSPPPKFFFFFVCLYEMRYTPPSEPYDVVTRSLFFSSLLPILPHYQHYTHVHVHTHECRNVYMPPLKAWHLARCSLLFHCHHHPLPRQYRRQR